MKVTLPAIFIGDTHFPIISFVHFGDGASVTFIDREGKLQSRVLTGDDYRDIPTADFEVKLLTVHPR